MTRNEVPGNLAEADSVIGHSFGTSTDPSSVNAQLAHQMLLYADGRPMIADHTLVNAMPNGENRMALITESATTNIKARTWDTLVEAHAYLEENELDAPIMIAQAYHINGVVKQAAKLGITSLVPGWLPTNFDQNSEQPWTRSAFLWVPYNALGSLILKKRSQA
jgi:hypothetical protein